MIWTSEGKKRKSELPSYWNTIKVRVKWLPETKERDWEKDKGEGQEQIQQQKEQDKSPQQIMDFHNF